MPIYEYHCPTCETRFERLRPMSLWEMPATCSKGHDDCQRIPSRFTAFAKDEYGDITTAGRIDESDFVPDGDDCGNLWTRNPVRGWDYDVDPDTGRMRVLDDKEALT